MPGAQNFSSSNPSRKPSDITGEGSHRVGERGEGGIDDDVEEADGGVRAAREEQGKREMREKSRKKREAGLL